MNVVDQLKPDVSATTAVVCRSFSLSYPQLLCAVSGVAGLLHRRGVGPHSRVALMLPNSASWVAFYYGVLKLGAVAVTVNVNLSAPEIEFILRNAGASIVVTTRELQDFGQYLPAGTTIVVDQDRVDGRSLRELDSEDDIATVNVAADSPAVILYTSGTTGFPKGAVLSHGNVLFCAHSKVRYTRMGSDDRALLTLPLHHCFAQNAILNPCVLAGATAVILPKFSLKTAVAAIQEHSISMLFGVPAMYQVMRDGHTKPSALASVRYCFSAGAPLPTRLAEEWYELYGLVLHEGYGLTESSPFATYNHEHRHRPGSVGTPIEGVDVEVVDKRGSSLPVGAVGEFVIRGPNVMLGYWRDRAGTTDAIVDGWLHTGDLGYRDEDGYLYVVDRLKDLIIVSGQNVYPAEVERVLERHPSVREVAVVGRSDTRRGEAVCAVVVPSDPAAPPSTIELRSFCAPSLAAFKLPTRIEIVHELPRSHTGKVRKRMLAPP